MVDDILSDLLESDEKPFDNKNQKDSENKNKNLYKDLNISGYNIPDNLDHSSKTFTVLINLIKSPLQDGNVVIEELTTDIKEKIIKICNYLFSKGYRLRLVYNDRDVIYNLIMKNCTNAKDNIDLYCPCKFPNLDKTLNYKMYYPNYKGYGVAFNHHQFLLTMKDYPRALCAAAVHTILDVDINRPLKLIIAYSANGAEGLSKEKKVGSMYLPYVLANKLSIPIFNLGNRNAAVERLQKFVKSFEADDLI